MVLLAKCMLLLAKGMLLLAKRMLKPEAEVVSRELRALPPPPNGETLPPTPLP